MLNLFETIAVSVIILLSLFAGNYLGDVATVRDCASKGEAVMLGGGTITCEVKRVTK